MDDLTVMIKAALDFLVASIGRLLFFLSFACGFHRSTCVCFCLLLVASIGRPKGFVLFCLWLPWADLKKILFKHHAILRMVGAK